MPTRIACHTMHMFTIPEIRRAGMREQKTLVAETERIKRDLFILADYLIW